MGTIVTQPVDPLSVDIEETKVDGIYTIVTSYTSLKTAYIAKLNKEKDWLSESVTSMNTDITNCTARETEVDTIITAVNNL